jgi:hypothetical protein
MVMGEHSLAMLRPSTWGRSVDAARSLLFDYAHLKTALTESCIDANGQAIPWYTYPAIEYLKQLDFRGRTVFEYGSGNSTLFWAARAERVVSVEDDEAWYLKMRPQLPANCELLLETDLAAYVDTITRYRERFDIIVVDGAARGGTRLRCSRNAVTALKRGGMVILDNSDWLPESARLLRESGLIQVDLTGFAPISGRTQSTSVFLHRECRFEPSGERQPQPGPGAIGNIWEHLPSTEQPLIEFDGEVFGGVSRDETFQIHSPDGMRTFRLIVARASLCGPGCAAILDVDRQRVLISLTEPSRDAASVSSELARALRMSWTEFCRFIRQHDKKRYQLDVVAAIGGPTAATS